MTPGLIATKIGMSRIFLDDGSAVPVTYLKINPHTVVRTKTKEKDGYNAVVFGVDPKTWKTRTGTDRIRFSVQKEWKVEDISSFAKGKEHPSIVIPKESTVTVSSVSKGKGFQGVMKRHNFAGGPKTHGSHMKREPGSVGMCESPGRILKGQKMPGRMGGDTITLAARVVLVSDTEEGVIAVKGPVPGPCGSSVYITVESIPEGAEESHASDDVSARDEKASKEDDTKASQSSETAPPQSS